MTHERTAAPHDRQEQIEQLYCQNYCHIIETSLADRRLLPQDAERVAESVAKHLVYYDGALNSQAFQQWAADVIRPAVARLSNILELRRQYRKSVLAGIWSVLKKSLNLKDHTSTGYILEQIEADTWAWAIEHLDDLLMPGRASLGTRLYAQGKFHALTWRKNRLRDLERYDGCDIEGFGEAQYFDGGQGDPDDHAGVARKLYFDPGGHTDDPELKRRRPQPAPVATPSDAFLAMKSGVPKLLCSSCQAVQPISPHKPLDLGNVKLLCGHERPAALSA